MMTYNKKEIARAFNKLDKRATQVALTVVDEVISAKSRAFLAFDEVEVTPYADKSYGQIVLAGADLELKLGETQSLETVAAIETRNLYAEAEELLIRKVKGVL